MRRVSLIRNRASYKSHNIVCFDFRIVVYAIAAGLAVPQAREKLVEMAPALRVADMDEIERILDSMAPQPTKMISEDGESFLDVHCETNVWMPAAEKVMENSGITYVLYRSQHDILMVR